MKASKIRITIKTKKGGGKSVDWGNWRWETGGGPDAGTRRRGDAETRGVKAEVEADLGFRRRWRRFEKRAEFLILP